MSNKNIIKSIGVLLATAAMIIVAGCDNGYDCALNNISYNNMGFYTIADNSEAEYAFPAPLTVSLMVNGKDSVVVNHITEAGEVSLPMSYTQNTDTVVFHYEDALTDSIYISHSNIPYYQSMECGTLMFHKLEDVKHTNVWIEATEIINKNVNFEGHENIKIYFYN